MSDSNRGQVISSAAEVYEAFFVPALFQRWAERVVDAAHIQPGQYVLDVACGTGVLARTAAERIGTSGSVIGLDVNESMLAVASSKAPHIQWHTGRAESLPFESEQFDAVVSQFGLMFFEDRHAALHEMMRVLKPGGHLAVAVWDILDHLPGYAAMAKLLEQLFGETAAHGLRAPFVLGNVAALRTLFDEANLPNAEITTLDGTVRFPSIESWVYTEIKGWVMADVLDDAQYERLLKEAQNVLAAFRTTDGSVTFSAPAHIISAIKG
jgi:ubiquinone/menaquinone biosynthesis C-methylase UbiE